ncbi:MAG TPA: hypothetical protein VK628_00675 [Flavitalea sp.]|nr:hypothetical protein [Flavitalea sp.]
MHMLNEKERLFVEYWKTHRDKEKRVGYQLITGLPIGLLFALPVMLLLFSGRFWYKRADMEANSSLNPIVLILAVLFIATFVALFYKRHQWDMRDQQYNELVHKDKTPPGTDS